MFVILEGQYHRQDKKVDGEVSIKIHLCKMVREFSDWIN
jgi:hypothetical protein